MNTKSFKKNLVRTSVLAGLAFVAAPTVMAQDVDTVAEAAEDTSVQQTIVVTGSRIPQQNLVGTSPVTTIGAGEITTRGVVRVEDIINTLPQAFAAQGSAISNGSTGTATVNLRGLGASRTLVLMNGRRMPYGSPGDAAADLNQIPAALVERVDVLTGGASAVYGSDAIAGVVNFIMKDDFEGVRIDTNYSFYQHDNRNDAMQEINNASGFDAPNGNVTDGNAFDITAIMGMNSEDGKGNITAYASYRNVEEVIQGSRDYSNCALTGSGPYGCGGSSTHSTANLLNLGALDLPTWFSVDDGNTFSDDRAGFFNYNPYNYYQRPDERYSFGVNGHYEFNKNLEVYTELSYMHNRTLAQIAPSGVFGGGIAGDAGGINCNNAFLSAQQVNYLCTSVGLGANDVAEDVLILRRNVEGGNRTDDLTHATFRGVMGARGEIADTGLNYDIYASFARVNLSQSYLNELSKAKVSKALNAVDDGAGNIVCAVNADADTSNDDPLCVPYDIFSNAGPSQAALSYVVSPLLANGSTDAQNVVGTISGDLGKHGIQLPSAGEGVGFSIGAEYRRNSLAFQPDAGFLSGDGYGQGGATTPISGSTESYEFFGEVSVPLVQDKPGIYDLGFEAAYRFSDYTTPDATTNTYKLAMDYAPVESIRFRASYQQAARTANIFELYAAQGLGLFDLTEGANDLYDPCAGANPAATAAQCANTGVTAAQYGRIADNPAGQFNQLTGGNLNLDPEVSETYTVGFVFEPTFLEGLSLTVDYFDITVEDFISTVDPEFALNSCLTTGDEFFCSLVNRGNGGTLWAGQTGYVTATNVNTGELATSGIDANAAYTFDVGSMGSLTLDYTGTYLTKLETKPLPSSTAADIYDSVGYYGGRHGTSNPEYRHVAGASWETPWNVTAGLTWRHFGEVELESGAQPLESQNYLDVNATYNVFENTSLRAGINNVMDDEPPLSSSVGSGLGNGNTFPQVYDALGRYIFFGATVDF